MNQDITPGWKSTEFLALPVVLTSIKELPEAALWITLCYAAYTLGRVGLKALQARQVVEVSE